MPWLAAHNPEIDWEKGEVRMTRCTPLCRKAVKIKGKKETREDEINWPVPKMVRDVRKFLDLANYYR